MKKALNPSNPETAAEIARNIQKLKKGKDFPNSVSFVVGGEDVSAAEFYRQAVGSEPGPSSHPSGLFSGDPRGPVCERHPTLAGGDPDAPSSPESNHPKTVPEILREAADTYEQRNKLYGDNYKKFGNWASQLFPDGLTVKTVDDWNRLGVLVLKMSKMGRYAENWDKGGHPDSLLDDVVYTAMLSELDGEE